MDRRRTDRAVKLLTIAFVTLAVGMTAVAFVIFRQQQAGAREARERINATCTLFERQERAAIDQLRRTYTYLRHPSAQLGELNRLVRAQVPQLERAARAVRAPRYCAPTDVGLHARPPRIPRRPRALR